MADRASMQEGWLWSSQPGHGDEGQGHPGHWQGGGLGEAQEEKWGKTDK